MKGESPHVHGLEDSKLLNQSFSFKFNYRLSEFAKILMPQNQLEDKLRSSRLIKMFIQ